MVIIGPQEADRIVSVGTEAVSALCNSVGSLVVVSLGVEGVEGVEGVDTRIACPYVHGARTRKLFPLYLTQLVPGILTTASTSTRLGHLYCRAVVHLVSVHVLGPEVR